MPPEATGAGMARVVLSTDLPARVVRVSALRATSGPRHFHGDVGELLCETTPCAVTLPYGDHEVRFTALGDPERTDATLVHVAQSTVVVNHTLGRSHTNAGHGLGGFVLGLGVVTTFVAAGLGMKASSSTTAPAAAAAAGFGMIALGGVLMGVAPNTEQPGVSTVWSPPPGAIAGARVVLGTTF
jgi:hypothetical protein